MPGHDTQRGLSWADIARGEPATQAPKQALHGVKKLEQQIKREAKHETIQHDNQTMSPLLRLPPELRNKIYEYVFAGHVLEPADQSGPVGSRDFGAWRVYADDRAKTWGDFLEFIALTQACRQLRSETEVLPWKICQYRIGSPWLIKNDVFGMSQVKREAVLEQVRYDYRHVVNPEFWIYLLSADEDRWDYSDLMDDSV